MCYDWEPHMCDKKVIHWHINRLFLIMNLLLLINSDQTNIKKVAKLKGKCTVLTWARTLASFSWSQPSVPVPIAVIL